jgi:hypothetical protein
MRAQSLHFVGIGARHCNKNSDRLDVSSVSITDRIVEFEYGHRLTIDVDFLIVRRCNGSSVGSGRSFSTRWLRTSVAAALKNNF